ncbi:MAG: PDDEXK nuclease domain-containing protein [Coxiellaceae bacterium]|nr:PDDEXK nuclease domain-containing protein [Coxiellaceae bacterium]
MDENQLSHALLNKLQQFLLELGKGFCFEARQKRILIGDEYFFIDLVLYHRILKCSVLIELKMSAFNHENIGQLNTYINYFKEHEMHPGDNPPVGILLCTKKNEALVKYAISDQNNKLFVSNYKLELPSEQEVKQFIESQLSKDLSYLVEENKK